LQQAKQLKPRISHRNVTSLVHGLLTGEEEFSDKL